MKKKKSPPKVLQRRHRRIKALTDEIANRLKAQLWHAALVSILLLPDICAALESPDGETTKKQYKAWYEKWLMNKYPLVSAVDLYRLRCGVAHEGKAGHSDLDYRIFFTVDSKDGVQAGARLHNGALILDMHLFAEDMIGAVDDWYAEQEKNQHVMKNLKGLVQYYPNGLSGYLDQPSVG